MSRALSSCFLHPSTNYSWIIPKGLGEFVGADNQAERVIARMEFREELAIIFHKAFRKECDLAPPWSGLSPAAKAGTIVGIRAVIDEIDHRMHGQKPERT